MGIFMIVLILVQQQRRLKKANKNFRKSQAIRAQSEFNVTSTTSTTSSRGVEPVMKRKESPPGSITIDPYLKEAGEKPNPAFGQQMQEQQAEEQPRLQSRFTKVFNQSELPIRKDKEEQEEEEEDEGKNSSEHVVVALPDPVAVPDPVSVVVRPSNNQRGFEETLEV
jgi:hypothetical protein